MFSIGIMIIIINSITIIVYIIIGNKPSLQSFISIFWKYFEFKYTPTKIIVSKFIINFVLQFISSVLEILTIFYLSSEYILL